MRYLRLLLVILLYPPQLLVRLLSSRIPGVREDGILYRPRVDGLNELACDGVE